MTPTSRATGSRPLTSSPSAGPVVPGGARQARDLLLRAVDVYAGERFAPIGTLMGPFLQWAAQRPKPIVIGEFGVAKAWGSARRRDWLRDASRTFKANPQVKAVVYFESDPAGNGPKKQFQLTGDKPAFQAFNSLVQDPYFNP